MDQQVIAKVDQKITKMYNCLCIQNYVIEKDIRKTLTLMPSHMSQIVSSLKKIDIHDGNVKDYWQGN